MLRHRRRIDRRGQIRIRNRHAEVHRLAAGNHPMHRIEVEQIADHDLRTHVAQGLRAFVFTSHHRTHSFALLQEQFCNRAASPANAARRAGDQNGICHSSFLPSPKSRVIASTRSSLIHCGSSPPDCSATMYVAYQSGQFSSRCPVRFSCSPWAASARRKAPARSRAEPNEVAAESMRPGSRLVISCSSHVLPSGSLNVANERYVPCSGSGPGSGPFGPKWKISPTSTPTATSASRTASMSETIRYVLCTEPGEADVRFLPNCIEHAEPGGVNWNTPEPGGVTSCRQPSLV